eukprot:scaffold66_cov233-Pinguiococcus_pyrenoidosus.AAC.10
MTRHVADGAVLGLPLVDDLDVHAVRVDFQRARVLDDGVDHRPDHVLDGVDAPRTSRVRAEHAGDAGVGAHEAAQLRRGAGELGLQHHLEHEQQQALVVVVVLVAVDGEDDDAQELLALAGVHQLGELGQIRRVLLQQVEHEAVLGLALHDHEVAGVELGLALLLASGAAQQVPVRAVDLLHGDAVADEHLDLVVQRVHVGLQLVELLHVLLEALAVLHELVQVLLQLRLQVLGSVLDALQDTRQVLVLRPSVHEVVVDLQAATGST